MSARSYRVHLEWTDGREAVIEGPADQTVLKAAEENGIFLPFGCRRGACATCTARLLEGEIDYRRPPRALKSHHRRQGYVLPCIACPRSSLTLEVGVSIQRELTSNPWR